MGVVGRCTISQIARLLAIARENNSSSPRFAELLLNLFPAPLLLLAVLFYLIKSMYANTDIHVFLPSNVCMNIKAFRTLSRQAELTGSIGLRRGDSKNIEKKMEASKYLGMHCNHKQASFKQGLHTRCVYTCTAACVRKKKDGVGWGVDEARLNL